MAGVRFDLATEADDAGLRRLLRENPMPGAISVTFEREPSYFGATAVEGPFHQTVAGRDEETGRIVGMASRSVRPVYLNGQVQPVGYLSQLRVDPAYGRGLFLARGVARACEYVRRLDADGRAPFYLVSIIADNDAANRLFSAGLPGLPKLVAYARYRTYAIHLGRRKAGLPLPAGLRLERGSEARVPALLACLGRNGVRRQFAPVWTADFLFSPAYTPGLAPHDFLLALDGDRVVGCLAGWDQGSFKQTIVQGYGGQLRRWRPVINAAARLGGWAPLPAPGRPIRHLYASHLAVDGDDPTIFAVLLRALYNHASEKGYEHLMLGLAEANPLCDVVTRAYRHTTYTSQLYLATWDDECAAIAQVDGRTPGPEIAVL